MAKENHTSVYFDRDKSCFVGLKEAKLKQLQEAYPGIDVDKELKKMGLWLSSPKGSKRKGNIGFIINWLNNAIAESAPIASKEEPEETPLRPWFNDYLKELWKGREHILEMNKKRRTS